ncbi:SDR family oxidoreductase [Nonomuraea wenchangensis]|uniref:SDR family oxidoreductase n=1 Tax=Nonomuraea wenchangensis TaxID=568860 RepID=UPI0034158A6C
MSTTRTTVVTGGTRGIGAAIARRVAASGGRVAAVYRDGAQAAERFAEAALADGLDISVHRADISSVPECRRLVRTVVEERGPVGALVNNAGVLTEAKVAEVTEEEWDRTLTTNLKSAFFLAQAVWPHLIADGAGRVVNIGSVTATSGNPVEAAYASSKAGLIGLTRSLALAGARKGVTVNAVMPGVYETDMTAGMPEDTQRRIAALIPVGRRGRPEELAHIVQALLHPDAGYITGAVIMADGGLGMGM